MSEQAYAPLSGAPSPSLVTQARLELATAAATTERSARPRGLVVLAIGLLLIAGVYTLYALSQRSAALAKVETSRKRYNDLASLVGEIRAMDQAAKSRGVEPNPFLNNELEKLAASAGVKLTGVIADTEVPGAGGQSGLVLKRYTARLSNQDPANLFNWLGSVATSPTTAGVELSKIGLRPSLPGEVPLTASPPAGAGASAPSASGGWVVDIEFSRWEKRK